MSEIEDTATSGSAARQKSAQLVSATEWIAGQYPRKCDLAAPTPSGAVRWFDIARSSDPESLFDLLGPFCRGLAQEMLAELLSPDEIPEGRRWLGGDVRLASSFAVHAPQTRDGETAKPVFTPSAEVVYEPVELLAGDGWLITGWHGACQYRGAELVERDLSPASRDELLPAVAKRWAKRSGGNAGDLGVLVMHELALTYAPTHRRFYTELEEWELRLHESGSEDGEVSEDDERRLHDLWGARARLRDWLNPLNIPGLRSDPDKAWLPATDHESVIAVDQRVDKALAALSSLGETLRSSFHLLHIKKMEAQRERNEGFQRRVEILATIFLVPTLIVGFFGANTWVPGENSSWGLLGMVAAIFGLTYIVVVVLRKAHQRHRLERTVRDRERFLP